MPFCEDRRHSRQRGIERNAVAGLPWFLLAFGIFIVIVGAFLAVMPESHGSQKREINLKMRDDEIIRELNKREWITLPSLVIAFGLLCCFISVVWRIALKFL